MVQTLVRNRFQRDREWSHVEFDVCFIEGVQVHGEGGKVSKKKSSRFQSAHSKALQTPFFPCVWLGSVPRAGHVRRGTPMTSDDKTPWTEAQMIATVMSE